MSHLLDRVLGFPPGLALVLVFVLPAAEASIFVGVFFPGELIILLGGVLANQHRLPLWEVLVVGSAGAIIGDSIGYEVGRHFGDRLLARLPPRLVKPEQIDRGRQLLRTRGGRAVFVGRFTATLRALVPGLAGTSRLPYSTFLLFNATGGVAWVTITALTGYLVGSSYHSAEKRLSLISFGILALVLVAIGYRAARRSDRLQAWARHRLTWLYRLNRNLVIGLVTVAASGWLFAGIGQDVIDHDGVALSDPRLLGDVIGRRTATLTPIAKVVSVLGTGPVVYGLLIVVGIVLWRRTRRWQPGAWSVGWLVAGQLVRLIINHAIARPRPPEALHLVAANGFAFPCGHTTTATIGYGLIGLLLARRNPAKWKRLATAAVLLAAMVGLSRVYLGVHWPTDVVGGWVLGAGWLALGAVLTLAVRLHRTRALPGDRHATVTA